ncbi:hypothetical protein DPQ28_11650, partial [Pasteurella multocida]
TSGSSGNVHGVGSTSLGGAGGGLGGAARAGDAGAGANTGRLSDGAVAEVLAADLGARLQLLVSVTAVELSRGLDVEGTVNLVKSGSRNVGEVTVEIESTSKSGKLRESVDDCE